MGRPPFCPPCIPNTKEEISLCLEKALQGQDLVCFQAGKKVDLGVCFVLYTLVFESPVVMNLMVLVWIMVLSGSGSLPTTQMPPDSLDPFLSIHFLPPGLTGRHAGRGE